MYIVCVYIVLAQFLQRVSLRMCLQRLLRMCASRCFFICQVLYNTKKISPGTVLLRMCASRYILFLKSTFENVCHEIYFFLFESSFEDVPRDFFFREYLLRMCATKFVPAACASSGSSARFSSGFSSRFYYLRHEVRSGCLRIIRILRLHFTEKKKNSACQKKKEKIIMRILRLPASQCPQ